MQKFFQFFSSSHFPLDETNLKNRKGQKGQLVLEYILLMITSVGIALLIQSQLTGGTQAQCANRTAPALSQIMCNITAAIATDRASGD